MTCAPTFSVRQHEYAVLPHRHGCCRVLYGVPRDGAGMSNQLPIRGIYDEWEREEKSRRDQSDRLKDLFKRAKDEGYNAKSLRQAFAEWYALEHFTGEKLKKRERDASDVDLYLANLAGVRTREIIEEIPPHDADGVILETSSPTTNGGDNETSEHSELVNLGRRQFRDRAAEGANADEHQHPQPAATHIAPTESAADEISAPIPQPAEGVTPTSAGHGDESAVLPSAALVVADRTKPNPVCQDPEDCGIEASWNHVCGSCLRRRAHVEAAGAVQ